MIARQRGQIPPGGSAGQWGSRNLDRVRWGANQSQRSQSGGWNIQQPWSWISQREKDEEQILGWQTVMRALLPGSRGHVVGLKRCSVRQVTDRWGDLSETAGAGLPCWSHALSKQESDTEHICLSISDITCVFPSKSVSYLWSCMEEVDDICSRSHREEVTLSRKRRGTSLTLQFWRCSFNNWINCVILHIKSPAQLSVSLRGLHTRVPPLLPWKSNKGPIAECWLSGGNKCLVVECFNIMAWLCSSGSGWIIWMWEITKYKNPHVMLLFLHYKIQQIGRRQRGHRESESGKVLT